MELSSYLKIQKDIRERIFKAYSNYKKSKSRVTLTYVEEKLSLLSNYWLEFEQAHRNILIVAEEVDTQKESYFTEDIFSQVEETYIEYKCALKEALTNFKSLAAPPEPENKYIPQESTAVKLPKIVLPTFSGKYLEWSTFQDLFESLIHKNTSLADVQKLHYLKTHLAGEAEQLLRHIPITEANYTQCWIQLKKRYDNKRYVTTSILTRLFGQKSLTAESSNGVKQLLDTTTDCLNALSNLGVDISSWDIIIIHLVTSKLDQESRKQWEQRISHLSDKLPTLEDFKSFLETRFRALEFMEPKERRDNRFKEKVERPQVFSITTVSCPFCSESHWLFQCKKFSKETFDKRHAFVQSHKLCFNCFGTSHPVTQCKRHTSCRRCGRRHHSLLHPEGIASSSSQRESDSMNELESAKQPDSQQKINAAGPSENKRISMYLVNDSVLCEHVMLPTALVKIATKKACHTLRVLLDQGAQASFITEYSVQLLGLRKIPVEGIVSGLEEDTFKFKVKHKVIFQIQSIYNSFCHSIQAYVINNISSTQPVQMVEIQDWPELSQLSMADPDFGKPGKVDVLLGSDIYGKLLLDGLVRNQSGTITAQNTQLGWILSGPIQKKESQPHCIVSMFIQDKSVNDLLRKFWELEVDQPQHMLSEEDQKCEAYYTATTTRDDSGRYIVKLPFRDEDPACQYGDSRNIALRRFGFLERKLGRDPVLKKEYSKVINEYLDLNHMKLIHDTDKRDRSSFVYLPHHAVVREDKTTTKVRVVFDASCKGSNGVSLNDDLLVGPRLQLELRHILIKWRTHPICFVADIVKMYRQIKVHDEHTKYQCLLWRENPEEEIKDYEMLRVTFGVSSAPYLAVKTLQQVAKDERKDYPLAADRVLDDFYMDDFMSGCQTEEEGIEIHRQVEELLNKGGFELQKWASNSRKIMDKIYGDKKPERNLEIKTDDIVKILGLSWNVSRDAFDYKVKLPLQKQPITKRVILGDISRLFDPLGWIAPVIIQAKIFMQKLWLAGLSWDDEVPSNLLEEWYSFRKELPTLNQVTLPRWLEITKYDQDVELHGFCDASQDAYAAVVYSRAVDHRGAVHVNLIVARTKVAPVKQVSIPRLELCGAVLLAKLLSEVSTIMGVSKTQLRAWTDSTVVLAWLKGQPVRWKTFVANRVTEIISVLNNDQWSHVESNHNPADCASRGLNPKELINHQLWLHGPQWLQEKSYEVPSNIISSTSLKAKIIKSHMITTYSSSNDMSVWSKYSSIKRLTRVIAYCKRFINKLKNKSIIFLPYLTAQELDDALKACLAVCQSSAFSKEIYHLENSIALNKSSKISSLCPFLDEDGLIRVRGSIQQCEEEYDFKHPIILPQDHHISKLIVADAHEKTLHGGYQLTLNYIRSKYWIVKAKSLVRQHIRRCVRCIRYSPSHTHPLMGQLPSSRVTISRPFSRSGVDYAGPINVRISKGRGCRCYKGYICLFICMVTRAIHLEAVSDLTSEGFLAAFRRFVARRGHCQEIWSDNGTNFVGASKELKILFKQERSSVMREVAEYLANNGTEWNFIPPRAPNFGGLWEAGIKSTKFHLKRVLDGSTLTYEELSTVLAQIEASLNSRPMYRLPSNQDDSSPLTPAHFLVHEPLVAVPDRKYDENVGTLKRWQLTQRLAQQFWRKWSQEYLTTLSNRYKWTRITPEPKIGDVVLVREDDLPPSQWLFGIIEQKHPGPDDITRVVTLKYKNSLIKRPVNKLCILPLAS